MNSQSCPCSTGWWLSDSRWFVPLKKAHQHWVSRAFCKTLNGSTGDCGFPLHIQTSLTRIIDEVVDAIHSKCSLARQQGIPFAGWEVGLQPEHAVHAGGIHLHKAFVEAGSDEIQRRC